ncbi:MAG: N-acetylmuramoyl-L-alanine amidase [Vicinamibacterales bacterium]
MAVAAWLSVCAAAGAQTAQARYDEANERALEVRVLLTNVTDNSVPADLVTQVRRVTTSFELIVRRFPTSGYADNALWQAATLAEAAHQCLNRDDDRERAVKFFRWLVQEYPASTYVKQANVKIASLTKGVTPTVPTVVAAATVAAATGAPPRIDSVADRATLTTIQRVVLPNAVRITLELDREVAYREERLAGPSRLFFDLKNVQLTPVLMDKVLTYGSDIVNKIRVGRHPDNTVRVVLDFQDVSRYSVFTLYSPFRLVIDAERSVARTVATPTVVAPLSTENAPLLSAAATKVPRLVAATRSEPAAPPALPSKTGAVMVIPAPVPPSPSLSLSPVVPEANAAGGFSIARQLGLSVSRIVIDPGHGGHDPGTVAKGLTEASLTLDVALRLEKLLQKELGIEVVLTRRSDAYIPLEERTAIANRQNADLFLSIHANSSRNDTAKGIETYFLSFASSPEAEALAARENSASEREMHQLPDIIKAISLNNKLDESRDLAQMVQESLVGTLRKTNKEVRSRGVKKAPFVVLIGAAMPSVLAEISFITNKQELQLLKTAAYKDKIAQALYAAVLRYRRSLKGAGAATLER